MHYMPFTYSLEPKASSFVKSNIGSDSGSEEDEELNIPRNADVCSNILKGAPGLVLRGQTGSGHARLHQACKSELGIPIKWTRLQ